MSTNEPTPPNPAADPVDATDASSSQDGATPKAPGATNTSPSPSSRPQADCAAEIADPADAPTTSLHTRAKSASQARSPGLERRVISSSSQIHVSTDCLSLLETNGPREMFQLAPALDLAKSRMESTERFPGNIAVVEDEDGKLQLASGVGDVRKWRYFEALGDRPLACEVVVLKETQEQARKRLGRDIVFQLSLDDQVNGTVQSRAQLMKQLDELYGLGLGHHGVACLLRGDTKAVRATFKTSKEARTNGSKSGRKRGSKKAEAALEAMVDARIEARMEALVGTSDKAKPDPPKGGRKDGASE